MSQRAAVAAERQFWDDVGGRFPSLKGAPSTEYYRRCEELLIGRFCPKLAGRRVLKTDLWDESRNTEILRWVAEQGARPFGIDVSPSIVCTARRTLARYRPGLVVADVRAIPFVHGSFDLVYSMGTIEHLVDYRMAIAAIRDALCPGGLAIVGVPNKLDPFLRPLLVHMLNAIGAYPFGREKSFTPGELRCSLEQSGLEWDGLSGILFLPGWLRLLDLWFHTRWRPLTALTQGPVAVFRWIYERGPVCRRHGYLIAAAARKPAGP